MPTTSYFRASALSAATLLAAALLAALLAVVVSAQAASAHRGHEASAGWFQRCSLAKTGPFDPIVYPNKPPTR